MKYFKINLITYDNWDLNRGKQFNTLNAKYYDEVAFLEDLDKAVFTVYPVGSQFSIAVMFVNFIHIVNPNSIKYYKILGIFTH